MRILVTGGAGYIGTLLLKRLIENPAVEEIISIDLLPPRAETPKEKISWLRHNLAENGWQEKVLAQWTPDAIVHLAFKIRSPYGKVRETEAENVSACRNVFEFAFENKIPRLIYTSSVAAYGAKEENIGILLKETSQLLEYKSPYGSQKRLVEEMLAREIRQFGQKTHAIVARLNSVTGPFGQRVRGKFGLITFLKKLLPFVIEANPAWARQFIHEKDVEELLVKLLETTPKPGALDIYNAAPPTFLTAKDIAKLLGKKTLRVPVLMVRPLFWLAWNLTLGKIPTHPDSANGLIYPINVDGSKVKEVGFDYRFGPDDAFLGKSV